MAKEISWEIRERAEELYIFDGLTFEAVAETTGVSISQLKRWSAASGWRDRKKEHRNVLTEIKRKKILLRQKLINSALSSKTPDPQAVYAFARMEDLAIRGDKACLVSTPGPEPVTAEPVKFKTPAEAVKALQTVVELKFGKMLASPEGLTLAKIKDFKQVLDLVEKMASEHQVNEKDKTPTTDADRERLINEVDKILGVK